MYEGQKEKNMNQQFNIEQIQFAQEGLKDTADTVAAMKTANKELKKQFKAVKVDEIEDLQDDMAELLEQAEEVQSALGRSYGLDDVDEADLEAELAAMEEDPSLFFAAEEENAGAADYLDLPASGEGEVSTAAPRGASILMALPTTFRAASLQMRTTRRRGLWDERALHDRSHTAYGLARARRCRHRTSQHRDNTLTRTGHAA